MGAGGVVLPLGVGVSVAFAISVVTGFLTGGAAGALSRRGLSRIRNLLELGQMARTTSRRETPEQRRAACLDSLPALLDVVTLGLSAGLSFDASLELYCSRNDGALARAFREAMLGWRIGAHTREEGLWKVAEDLGLPALRRFASVVGEALAFGAPLAEALEGQAHVIRDEQRAQVEERIERVPVKMLIPLGTLVVPAMFLAVLGPLLGSVMG